MTLADAVPDRQGQRRLRQAAAAAAFVSQQGQPGGGEGRPPAPKSLVGVHQDLQEQAKRQKQGRADWEGQHPWRPFDRDTDLDIRRVNPKGKETILNNNVMGSLSERFGGAGAARRTSCDGVACAGCLLFGTYVVSGSRDRHKGSVSGVVTGMVCSQRV